MASPLHSLLYKRFKIKEGRKAKKSDKNFLSNLFDSLSTKIQTTALRRLKSDSWGIQTLNLLIRSQMLYSVELRSLQKPNAAEASENHNLQTVGSIASAKVERLLVLTKPSRRFFQKSSFLFLFSPATGFSSCEKVGLQGAFPCKPPSFLRCSKISRVCEHRRQSPHQSRWALCQTSLCMPSLLSSQSSHRGPRSRG